MTPLSPLGIKAALLLLPFLLLVIWLLARSVRRDERRRQRPIDIGTAQEVNEQYRHHDRPLGFDLSEGYGKFDGPPGGGGAGD